MHRKHKSTKVPNVKLRPRPAASSSSLRDAIADDNESSFNQIIEDRNRLRDAELDHREAFGPGAAAVAEEEADGPLTGANFCFTGVTDDKTALAHAAYQLGAKVEGNLTESTTHLIALNPLSFKYECALSLGLYILLPQLLFECIDRWREAQELNVDALIRKYTLKPLQNLKVGICGIEDRREREHMKSRLKGLGAILVYPMLIQDDVTHLVCGTADKRSSSTLETVYSLRRGKVGQSDERRAADQLKCVRVEWVEDCASVGGRLSEEIYDIWTHRQAPSLAERAQVRTSVPVRSFAECKKRFHNTVLTQQRINERLQREEEEQRRIKLEGQSSREALLKKSLASVAVSKDADKGEGSSKAPSGSSLLRMGRAVEEAEPRRPAASFAQERDGREQTTNPPAPEDESTIAEEQGEKTVGDGDRNETSPPDFPNLVIRIDISPPEAAKSTRIQKALLDTGVQQRNILTSADRSRPAQYCLTSSSGPSVQERSGYGTPVTTFWLEQCIHYERIIDPSGSSSPAYLRPAEIELPVTGAENCLVSLTGFPVEDEEPDRNQLTRCLREMGCNVTGPFSRKNTHLLSAHPDRVDVAGSKERKASEWGIPVVGVDFVERMWVRGVIEPPPTATLPGIVRDKTVMAESLPMAEIQEGLMPPPAPAKRAPGSLCRDITNQTGRTRDGDDLEVAMEQRTDKPASGADSTETQNTEERPADVELKVAPESLLQPQGQEQSTSPHQLVRPHARGAQSPPQETIDTQASSLAGQSMWATRMEGEVTAFLAARKKSSAVNTSPTGRHGSGAGDMHRSVSGTSGSEEPGAAATPSAAGAKRRGKLPPKSRRSASGTAASPAPGRRGGSTSPVKNGAGSAHEGEGDEAAGEQHQQQDAAQILLAQRTLAALQAQAQGESSTSSTTDSDGTLSRNRSHYSALGANADGAEDEEAEEREVDGSIKITYRDPLAERERRRLEDLLEGRGPGASTSAAGAGGAAGGGGKRRREESAGGASVSAAVGDGGESDPRAQEQEESSEIVLLGGGGPAANRVVDLGGVVDRAKDTSPSRKRIMARKQPGMGR